MSEPLFLALTLGGFLLADVFYQTGRRVYLIYALICLAIAWLTRYVGIVAIGTLVCVFTMLRQQGWKQTLFNIGLTIVIPLVPILLWTVRNFQIENQFLDRNIAFTPLGIKNWLSIIRTLAGWLLPGRLIYGREKWIVICGICLLILILAWWFAEAKKRNTSLIQMLHPMPLIPIYILFGILYVPFVILSKLFFDPMIGFTERMLIPTQLSVLVIVPAFLNFLWKSRKWLVRVLVVAIALLLLIYYANEGISRLQKLHKQGLGVANRRWHESEVIQRLRTLDDGVIYSNSLSTMYLWRGEAGWYFTDLEYRNMNNGENPVYLAVFHYLAPNARLQSLMDQLSVMIEDEIATIYLYPSNGLGR